MAVLCYRAVARNVQQGPFETPVDIVVLAQLLFGSIFSILVSLVRTLQVWCSPLIILF